MKKLLLLLLVLTLFALPTQGLLAADAPINQDPSATNDEFFAEDPFADEDLDLKIYDPIEPVNRSIYWFNDKLYFYLLKPVAKGWRIVPAPARNSVGKFFSNLATPIRLINALLQLKVEAASSELHRFIVNSTIGLGGLFDPATKLKLIKKDEDLGQTFGHYGLGSGPYLVLPILGPSNLRDGVGRIGDAFLHPFPYTLKTGEAFAAKFVEGENELSLDKNTYEGIKKHEIDPYLFIRSAYEQNRAAKVSK